MAQTIRVGMADLAIAKAPDCLETLALGSCVAIVLYDPVVKIGGLAHAMLPDIHFASINARDRVHKFVNTAIEVLVDQMVRHGVSIATIRAKLVGGANMFPGISANDVMHIGERNVQAARAQLVTLNIRIVAEQTGGSLGRSIHLDTQTGKLTMRTITHRGIEI